ncbi:MAG TPA: zeta toxin family protein [Acidimicrobiales bacterium]|nr:zeta toxin family protein [Acidimicrobiales bacterium]
MSDPVLHVLAGPNGAGKSAFFEYVLGPATHLEFVNADEIAAQRWPDDPIYKSYDAALLASARRMALIEAGTSFITETVFSHDSKLDLVRSAIDAGYLVSLHVILVPEALAVARVASRVVLGGHDVPEHKIRQRYVRLWPLVVAAIGVVGNTIVYDNSRASDPFRIAARFDHGSLIGEPEWPPWAPDVLVSAAR